MAWPDDSRHDAGLSRTRNDGCDFVYHAAGARGQLDRLERLEAEQETMGVSAYHHEPAFLHCVGFSCVLQLADAGSLSLAEAKASSLKDLAEQKGMSPAKVRDLLIEKIK